jgi:hypothetical protein
LTHFYRFNRHIGKYLPKDIIPGLLELPSTFSAPSIPSIQITPLPKIEVDTQDIIQDVTISKVFTDDFKLVDVKNISKHRKTLENDLNTLLDYMSDVTKELHHTKSLSTDLDGCFNEEDDKQKKELLDMRDER